MLVSKNILISCNLSAYLLHKRNDRKPGTIFAKKPELSENSKPAQPTFPLRISNAFLARSAVAVFGLGFIDAGYSGDWTRIGVISKETEDLLKVAALVIAPLCVFLVLSISSREEGRN
ncbi:hypothetical protein QJS04_geneDACA001539 [Acorus gramineus]|uniref:DUF7887 domain-containing protein n=1 Tax=Acorus gramineus TaxID=55184 RepID=A0AAV9BK63_ACOGR|nr:hypothetical protein QJS04_geneDACA001539 [Acorus gramineus]